MEKQVLIITVGYPGSGKSTLVNQIREKFPTLNIVDGDPLRDLLIKEVNYFSTLEFSEMTPAVKGANVIAKEYKRLVFEELIRNKQSVLIEGNHLERDKRDKWFSKAKELNPDIVTILLYLKIDDEQLIERYKEREEADPGAVWISEFKRWRKEQLEEPTKEESDHLLVFGQTSLSQRFQKLLKQPNCCLIKTSLMKRLLKDTRRT